MKRLLFGAVALAGMLTVSCTKEMNSPDPVPAGNQVVMTFQASVGDATRTAYANEKTFSWSAGDEISVRLYDPSTEAYSWVAFATEEGGATATFSASVDEGLEFGGLAYYDLQVSDATAEVDGVPCAWLHYEIDCAKLEDPLSIVPLVGLQVPGSNKLEFQTATGVIKIPIKNLPPSVNMIVVYANEEEGNTLCGRYALDEFTYLAQDAAMEDASYPDLWIYPDADAEGNATIYVPAPVGTLYAGLEVEFCAGLSILASKATVKDVEVERNAFITFPAIDVTEILQVGTATSVPALWNFETGEADGWTFIDADQDGENWFVSYDLASVSGDYCLTSASYLNPENDYDDGVALTPDNWAFTPQVQLTSGNYLSFWVRALDPDYCEEHYAVYITTGEPSVDAEVLIGEIEYPGGDYVDVAEDGYYQQHVIQIPASYNGKVVRIGFRHFNCSDEYMLVIDDVSITEELPYKESTATYQDYLGDWDTGSGVISVEEKVSGSTYSISGLIGQGDYPVEASFENHRLVLSEQIVSSKGSTDIILAGLYPYTDTDGDTYLIWDEYYGYGPQVIFRALYDEEKNRIKVTPGAVFTHYIWLTYVSQEYDKYGGYSDIPELMAPYVPDTTNYIYEEHFEGGIGSWTLIDADGDGYNWTQSLSASVSAHFGSGCLYSMSYNNETGALTPDNWAFTPAITLTSDNYLSFWVRAQDLNYPEEHYAVYITTAAPTAGNLASCAVLLPEQEYPNGDPAETSVDGAYQRFIVPIPASYNGKAVYIGFRHFNCTDAFYLNLDDVAVSEGAPVVASAPARVPKAVAVSRAVSVSKAGNIRKYRVRSRSRQHGFLPYSEQRNNR